MIYAFHDNRIPRENAERLRALGFCPIALPKIPSFSEPVGAHVDLEMIRVGEALLIHPELARTMPKFAHAAGVMIDDVPTEGDAPEERLCALMTERFVFGNQKLLSRTLVSLAKKAGIELVHTNQGYAKCSTLLLDGTHAITADAGMCRAMEKVGINVLKIGEGGVVLPPYPYGFIGGASGVFDRCVYFLGPWKRIPRASGSGLISSSLGCVPFHSRMGPSLTAAASSFGRVGRKFFSKRTRMMTVKIGIRSTPAIPKTP